MCHACNSTWHVYSIVFLSCVLTLSFSLCLVIPYSRLFSNGFNFRTATACRKLNLRKFETNSKILTPYISLAGRHMDELRRCRSRNTLSSDSQTLKNCDIFFYTNLDSGHGTMRTAAKTCCSVRSKVTLG